MIPAMHDGLRSALAPTQRHWLERLQRVLTAGPISGATWEGLEETLVAADVGAELANTLVDGLRAQFRFRLGATSADVFEALRRDLVKLLLVHQVSPALQGWDPQPSPRPRVVLVVGVNGSGKTTSIAKLATWHQRHGRGVLLAAADTYRAAAIEQLQLWGRRLGVPVVAGKPSGDPGAVVYDAVSAAAARDIDVVIVDTAGRLHTQHNLMRELTKLAKVARGRVAGAPHDTLLVLDATTGQNGLAQARAFNDALDITGVLIAKLDSTSRGGVAFAVVKLLGSPIRFVGVGESGDDLVAFDPQRFVAALLDGTRDASEAG
jgi:fused signal recognition particle receptor